MQKNIQYEIVIYPPTSLEDVNLFLVEISEMSISI